MPTSPSDQLEVTLVAQKLVLADTCRQLAAYQRTVLKLLRLFERTDVEPSAIQGALAEVSEPKKDAATLVAEAAEGATHGNC